MLREAEVTVQFANSKLERLYTENVGADRYEPEIIKLFRRRVRHIEAASDLNDLRCPNLVDYRELEAGHPRKSALALDERWELVLAEEVEHQPERILILDISERH
jgi:plasmid maintenance system killer protein